MTTEALAKFPWPSLPSLALGVFFLFFVGLIVVTHFRARTPVYKHASTLPLEEGDSSHVRH